MREIIGPIIAAVAMIAFMFWLYRRRKGIKGMGLPNNNLKG